MAVLSGFEHMFDWYKDNELPLEENTYRYTNSKTQQAN